jgi:hypothetical protein
MPLDAKTKSLTSSSHSGLPQRIHDHDPAEAALARCLVIVVRLAEDMMAEMERHCASLCLLAIDPVIIRARVITAGCFPTILIIKGLYLISPPLE